MESQRSVGSSRWDSFVALGDSFTEGLADTDPAGGFRGWADRLVEHLTAQNPELRYANLAVRGKLIRQIVADQVPQAVELRPALVPSPPAATTSSAPAATPTRSRSSSTPGSACCAPSAPTC
ncbi:SGNH/GDSL hydrolase family protein [Saccharopolyspora sp. NPDC000995]